MGIEPTSVAWEATVMAIIRRPQRARFYAGTRSDRNSVPAPSALGAEHGQLNGEPRDDHQQHLHDHEQHDRR